jgi:hypothetical protein
MKRLLAVPLLLLGIACHAADARNMGGNGIYEFLGIVTPVATGTAS